MSINRLPEPESPLTPPRSDVSADSSDLEEEYPVLRRRKIPCSLMRAGTSKGLFFRLGDLPEDRDLWHKVITSAMGSPDPFSRQLDGVGGGQSTTSKVAIVSASSHPDADVDYLFVQVPVNGTKLDFSGNCGNMASGVGPFAVEESLYKVKRSSKHSVTVRIRNVNTDRILWSTFEVKNYLPVETGKMRLDGVSVPGAPIKLDFMHPSGSMTGKLLPTGNPIDVITLPPSSPLGRSRNFRISCIDAANPFVFVSADDLGLKGMEIASDLLGDVTKTLMEIRAVAAVMMGLAPDPEAATLVMGTPKIAIVRAPCDYITPAGREVQGGEYDLWVRAFSMGLPHPAIQMTGAVCVGAATAVPGCLVNEVFVRSRSSRGMESSGPVIIGHGSGVMAVEGKSQVVKGEVIVESGTVYRTARHLMEGSVICYA